MFSSAVRALCRTVPTVATRQLSTSRALLSLRPLGPKNTVPAFKGTAVVDGDFKVKNNKYIYFFQKLIPGDF